MSSLDLDNNQDEIMIFEGDKSPSSSNESNVPGRTLIGGKLNKSFKDLELDNEDERHPTTIPPLSTISYDFSGCSSQGKILNLDDGCQIHNSEVSYSKTMIEKYHDPYYQDSKKPEGGLKIQFKEVFRLKKFIFSALLLLILLQLSIFLPLLIILSKGTKVTVFKYFENSSREQCKKLITELRRKYLYSYEQDDVEGSNLGTLNSRQGLNPEYLKDDEILKLLNSLDESGTTFYGLAYTPDGAMEPSCGVNQREVLLDIAKISTVTNRIRSYGVQCNQTAFILTAFKELNLNMTLSIGVWIGSDNSINRKQIATMKELLRNFPRKYFEYIFIGNEVLFREDLTINELITLIIETKEYLTEIGYDDILVGTTEIGSLITKELAKSCDIIGANIHPFFGGGVVENASKWSFNYIEEEIEPYTEGVRICITEVGWPSGGGRHKGAEASLDNFQYFLNSFVCDAYNHDYPWYYFEAFDGPWKKIFHEGDNKWETQWGIFTANRELKPEALPNC